jgi:hypothetical protein
MTETVIAPAAPAPPANPAEAEARLTSLKADSGWAGRLISGDVHVAKEYRELSAMVAGGRDEVAIAMAGSILPEMMPTAELTLMAGTAQMLREIGIPDPAIKQTLSNHEVTQAEHDATVAWKSRMLKDPVFVKAYLANEAEPRQKMALAAIILSSNIRRAAA